MLLPYSPVLMADAGYRDDVDLLRATCRDRGVAVQTIKAIARRRWRDDDPSKKFSWYEPIRDPAAIERAVRFVLAEDDLFFNTSSDATLLGAVLEIAGRLGDPVVAPSADDLAADAEVHQIEPIFDGGSLERI